MKPDEVDLYVRPECLHCQLLALGAALSAAVGCAVVMTLAPVPATFGMPDASTCPAVDLSG